MDLDHKEGWVTRCFRIVVLEKTLESPLDYKEIKLVNPKGNQPWIFIGRTDAETAILWPPDAKSQRMGKDPDAGKDWRREEKGMTEDEMVRWHHRLNRHEFEQTPGDGEGQESLVCCSPWGLRVGHDLVIEQQQQQLSAWAAITNYHWLGGLKNRNLFPHSSRGQKPKIKALAGLISLWHEDDCFLAVTSHMLPWCLFL